MVIEEHQDSRELMKFVLERAGYEVFTVEAYPQAFKQLEVTKPDLIILDLTNTQEDFDNLHKIQSETEKKVPILLTTCDARSKFQWQLKSDGFQEIFTKPLEMVNLIEAIAQHLG